MFTNYITCANCGGRGIAEHWKVEQPGKLAKVEEECPVCKGEGYIAYPVFTLEEAEVIAKHFGFNKTQITNFEKLKSMTIDELADWLDKYSQYEDSPWATWFNNTYCNKCEPIKCAVDEKNAFFPGHTVDCAYCELEHKCKHFPELEDVPDNKAVIKMWLEEESI